MKNSDKISGAFGSDIIIKSGKLSGVFGLESDANPGIRLTQMPELTGEWIGNDTLGKRYLISDVDTTERADWFLEHRLPGLANTPLLIVTHQDFMKEVFSLINGKKYPHIKIEHDPHIDGDIPNLSILLIRYYTSNGSHKDIFLMRHCFACNNIKDNSVLPSWVADIRNFYTEKKKKGLYWQYGELSICIQEDPYYMEAVENLRRIARDTNVDITNLYFACSPLFRTIFTLVKVLQFFHSQKNH